MVLREKHAKEPWRHIGLKVPHHVHRGHSAGSPWALTRRDTLIEMHTDVNAVVPHASLGYHFLRVQVRTIKAWGLQKEERPKAQETNRRSRVEQDDSVPCATADASALYQNICICRDEAGYPTRLRSFVRHGLQSGAVSPCNKKEVKRTTSTIQVDPCDFKGRAHTHSLTLTLTLTLPHSHSLIHSHSHSHSLSLITLTLPLPLPLTLTLTLPLSLSRTLPLSLAPHAGLGYHFVRVRVRTPGSWRSSRGKGAKLESRKRNDGVTT